MRVIAAVLLGLLVATSFVPVCIIRHMVASVSSMVGDASGGDEREDSIRRREREAEPQYRAAVAAAEAAGDFSDAAKRSHALDAIVAALKAGACPTRTLSEEAFAGLHTQPRFREAIRDHARQSEIVMVTPKEVGEALRVSGVVRDADGKPVAGALIYVYHTDRQGLYNPAGIDSANPRLFGYMRTDREGRYAYRTIRPASYPDRSEPVEQHVHYEVSAPGFRDLETRLGFADDPFWQEQRRTPPRWAVAVAKDAEGVWVAEIDVRLERS
jgi:protocatechuate 3,4-dioxygenase beta subunit